MNTTAIKAEHVALVLAAAKLRRSTGGSTCALCALSRGPMLQLDCSTSKSPHFLETALRLRYAGARVTPMQRGGIALLYERTRRERGTAEVRRTWGAGIKALRAEPRHVFNGGTA